VKRNRVEDGCARPLAMTGLREGEGVDKIAKIIVGNGDLNT
jgi:hypothetical protein